MNELGLIFWPVFKAVSIIFIVAFFSGVLVRKGVISQQQISALSHITIVVLLPCLMISKILLYFDPTVYTFWWKLPIIAVVMIGTGILLGKLFFFKKFKQKKNFVAVGAFMNANYMVLPIAQIIFEDSFNEFAAFCFLFIIGVNPTLWSIGKQMVTDGSPGGFKLKGLITPPFVATISSVIIVLLGLNQYIPSVIIKPISLIGEAAIPIATLVLGATLGSISFSKFPPLLDIVRITSIKLLFIPLITIIFLKNVNWFGEYEIIADLLMLQSAVAPATQLVIQIRKYGGDAQNVGSLMLVSYLLCIITVPAWFTLWQVIK